MAKGTQYMKKRMVKNTGDFHPPLTDIKGPTTMLEILQAENGLDSSEGLHRLAEEAGIQNHREMSREQIETSLRAIHENKRAQKH